eukprot:1876647-Amphidinium_carterae.1
MDRNYTHYYPMNETAIIHLNYTDWRDHFDSSLSSPYGQVVPREPRFSDAFGTYALKLWEDRSLCGRLVIDCQLQHSSNATAICNGNYTDGFGLALKEELDLYPRLPQVNGSLTYVVSTKVDDDYSRRFDSTKMPSSRKQSSQVDTMRGKRLKEQRTAANAALMHGDQYVSRNEVCNSSSWWKFKWNGGSRDCNLTARWRGI